MYKSDTKKPTVGNYLMFKLQHEVFKNKEKTITKKIVCSEGQTIKTINNKYFCNKSYLGKTRGISAKGKPIPIIKYDQVIPKNYVFVMGSHPLSFDSRNYGLIEINEHTQYLKPIWRH